MFFTFTSLRWLLILSCVPRSGVYFQGTTIGMAPIMSMCTVEQSGGIVMVRQTHFFSTPSAPPAPPLSLSPCTFKKWRSAFKPAAVCWRWCGPEVWQEVAIAKCNLLTLAPCRLSCPCHHCKHQYVQTHTYTCIGEWLAAYNQRDWRQEVCPSKGRLKSRSHSITLCQRHLRGGCRETRGG